MLDHHNHHHNDDTSTQLQHRLLMDRFWPILELLWPHVPQDNLYAFKDAIALVRFFSSRGVFRFEKIGAFDAHHFKLKRQECPLFESEYLVGQLGYLCRYVAFKGPHALLRLKRKHCSSSSPLETIHQIETAVAQHISKHGLYRIGSELDVSPGGLNRMSLVQARRWLTHLLAKLDFWTLPSDENRNARESWLRLGALHLLDRFPVLASEHVKVKGDKKNFQLYPYAYMLWGGFDRTIIHHVVQLCPRALLEDIRKNQHMTFLKEHRSCCQKTLPLRVIDVLLSANKSLLQTTNIYDRRTNPLIELLIRYAYPEDVLVQLLRNVSPDLNSLWLTSNFDNPPVAPFELSEVQAIAVEILLPQLRFFECRVAWSIPAETKLLRDIAVCCQNPNNNNLESLKITLSPYAVSQNMENMVHALRNVMLHLNQNLRTLSWKLQDPPQLMEYRRLHPRQRRVVCDRALEAILDGLYNNHRKENLQELTLQGFSLSNSEYLDLLVSQEEIGCLNMQLDGNRDVYDFKTIPLNGKPRIERLNLYDCSLSDQEQAEESWTEFWNSLSLTTALESILLVPRHRHVLPQWIPKALEAVSDLSALRRLELGPHSYFSADPAYETDCVDITDPIGTLLDAGCVETLKIHSAGNQYFIRVDAFCDALSRNKTLRSLDLLGTVLDGVEITKSFLDALHKSNNVTLQNAVVYDDRCFYTPTTIETHRRKHKNFEHYNYENYQYAAQILHLCDSNLCGRGWIQKKSTKVADLVGLLDNVRPTLGMESDDFKLARWCQCADLNWSSDLYHLEQLYLNLVRNPMMLCNASQMAQDTVSIQYTLLRENPGMWCHSCEEAESVPTPSPRKRQRVE